ncbi:MAG TPA: ADP-glyceromanno-heptose 6-epimerase [Blastocatellia bacterium]
MTKSASKKVIVTGGAGMIGSATVWHLNRLDQDRIVVVDRMDRTEKWRNLSPLRFLDYVDADDLLRRIREKPSQLDDVETVFHLGACSSTTETDAAYMMRNNFEYTRSLAHWAVANGIRFVYASSAATYGSIESSVSEDLPSSSLRPLNLYGYVKHLFDCYAERAGLLDRIVGLKYFNVYGPNEDHKGEMRSVVHKAFQQIRDTGKLKLFKSYRPDFADGCQQRDFIYVKDAVAMTVYLAGKPDAKGIFNIGSGTPHTWLELADAIFGALGQPAQIDFIPMPEELRLKYQYRTCASIEKLRSAGYDAPITPLRDAVADYVRQYLSRDSRLGDEAVAQ